jgi:hypothetical protein
VTKSEEPTSQPAEAPVSRALPAWAWGVLAASAATIPFLPGLTGSRIFYVRDLSLFFWARYLWLRRTLLSGEWPLWDPYVGAGQSAVVDALHQMFLLPVLLIRLLGTEVQGFNWWVSLPFPFAALGAWAFFARRFSAPASALAAVAFAACGPIVSTGNFPNMSWSVASMPWVLWAVDRAGSAPTAPNAGVLALAVAFQALAGEPVTFFSTFVLAVGYAVAMYGASAGSTVGARVRQTAWVSAGLGLGVAMASIQLIPMIAAAALADRSNAIIKNVWSLHPAGLLETVAFQLLGDYYKAASLSQVPWIPLVNGGREPFFFSVYFGVPLLTLALFGLVAGGPRRWSLVWVTAGSASLIGAFGVNTPIYPFLQDHLPLLGSFRFPVKYLVVLALAIAAGVAAGWDAISGVTNVDVSELRRRRARTAAIALALVVGSAAYALAGACIYFATPAAFQIYSIAKSLRAADPIAAAEFMLRALPRLSTALMLLSVATAGLMFVGTSSRKEAPAARYILYVLIAGDLLVRAWGINPVFDPGFLAEPKWLAYTKGQSDSRFYVGGKREGTLDATDPDSSRAFLNPPGLLGSAGRAALSSQAAFYPSPWRVREMLSYDLAILWPKDFQRVTERFLESGPDARDRFLDRTGVRYRALPRWRAAGHAPLVQIPYFLESFLYDWGAGVAPRAAIISEVKAEPRFERHVDLLFEEGWDSRVTAIVDHEPVAAGDVGSPVAPAARIVEERVNRVVVEAGVEAQGGYLILLDSYSKDWQVTVDAQPASLVRANALFRGVRLAPGRHVVEFAYRPRAFLWGAALTAASFMVWLGLMVAPRRG